MDPKYFESDFRSDCQDCFDCFHQPCKPIADLQKYFDKRILGYFMRRHHHWLVLTKVNHQVILRKPMIVRRIYTKAWDTSGAYHHNNG